MTLFATNATLTWGLAVNRWDESLTVSLAGKRTIGNSRTTLANSGDNVLTGTAVSEAFIYDNLFNNALNASGTTQRFANTFTSFDLGGGDDVLDLTVDRARQQRLGYTIEDYTTAVTAVGGSGADTIWTGYGADTIYGDTATGALIDLDIVLGDAYGFADLVHGGDGNDTIYGDYGTLSLVGVSIALGSLYLGGDTLYGGEGDDTIYGDAGGVGTVSISLSLLRAGDDTIYGGGGNDTIIGDFGAGGLLGASVAALAFGDDTIYGGSGTDTLIGDLDSSQTAISVSVTALSFGSDTIYGGADGDTIIGDARGGLVNLNLGAVGNDHLYGEGGNDIITGDVTGSLLGLGGALNFGRDYIDGGNGDDNLVGDYRSGGELSALPLSFGNDIIRGGAGNDTIYGDTSDFVLLGALGGGADVIDGGTGNDNLWGEYSASISVNGGADTFYFGANSGQDRIHDFRRTDGDKIWIDVAGITSYGQLNITTGLDGLTGYSTVSLGNGNTIRVDGTSGLFGGTTLNPADFQFGAPPSDFWDV